MMEEIQGDEIGKLLRGRMGLIVGPGFTMNPRVFADLSTALAERFGVERSDLYLTTADRCLGINASDDQVKETIRSFLATQSHSPWLSHLAKVKWNAILSLALDGQLEDRLQREADRRGTRQTITTLDESSQPPPPRTVPSYKLLGIADREKFAYSTITYKLLRPTWWRRAVKGFADRVKGSGILCVGMDECPWAMEDLLVEMLGQPTCSPGCILLLAEDPLRNNANVTQLVESRGRLVIVRSTLGEMMTAVASAEKKGYAPFLSLGDDQKTPMAELHPCGDLAVLVNGELTTDTAADERERLLDLLFAPTFASWAPFVHGLDFARTSGDRLRGELLRLVDGNHPEFDYAACIMHGRAASGKTVLLKRLAYDLAQRGDLVLWLKTSSLGESLQTLKLFFESVARSKAFRGKRLLLFVDDPPRFSNIQCKDIYSLARSTGVRVILVAGFRSADWLTRASTDLVGQFSVLVDECLPDDLDDAEWSRLPDYLVSLGISADLADARTKTRGVETRHAQDTLSVLYWLLPQTRSMIASSVRDEFFRLGDTSWMADVVEGAKARSTELLKSAYEMVAVADHYRAPLPIEVLVTGLEVDYDRWLHAAHKEGPAWGLLYAEESEDGETTCYRTRNYLVTRILIDAINGGVFGHAGEIRVLSKLLGACTNSQAVYRDFCVRILVANEQMDGLGYQEGLQLFDLALESLPYPERTILHHKGLWIKNKGNDPVQASRVLEEALRTGYYPHARRQDVDEHIHTSMAANVLEAIDQGAISLNDGKRQALQHLERAKSPKFFSPKAVHVQANLVLKLAEKEESSQSPDTFQLVNRALSDVDHALILLQNPLQSHRSEDDIRLLDEVKDRVFIAFGDVDELKAQAASLWQEHQSQQGFALAARKLYQIALRRNRGRDFRTAFEYCQLALKQVAKADVTPSPSLFEAGLHIYYRWQIQRSQVSNVSSPILWEVVRDYSGAIIRSPGAHPEPFIRYLHALAISHLNKMPEARVIFGDLRALGISGDLLWEPRDYLLNVEGGLRKVQGVIKQGARDLFFYSEDLHMDFPADRRDEWSRPGEIAHANIRFCFGGPKAVAIP